MRRLTGLHVPGGGRAPAGALCRRALYSSEPVAASQTGARTALHVRPALSSPPRAHPLPQAQPALFAAMAAEGQKEEQGFLESSVMLMQVCCGWICSCMRGCGAAGEQRHLDLRRCPLPQAALLQATWARARPPPCRLAATHLLLHPLCWPLPAQDFGKPGSLAAELGIPFCAMDATARYTAGQVRGVAHLGARSLPWPLARP